MNRTIVRTIGALGALFNAAGVQSYLAHVGVLAPAAGAPPADAVAMPALVTTAFAIAVFGGVIGSVGLALLQSWARPVLWLAFVGAVVDWGWVFANDDTGSASVPLGVTVIVVSLVLALTSERLHRASGADSRLAAT